MDKTSSDFLNSLKNPQKPDWIAVFNRYNNGAIASKLGISTSFLCSLKSQYKTPSKKLQLKIDNLFNEIIQAESLAATINKEGADNE